MGMPRTTQPPHIVSSGGPWPLPGTSSETYWRLRREGERERERPDEDDGGAAAAAAAAGAATPSTAMSLLPVLAAVAALRDSSYFSAILVWASRTLRRMSSTWRAFCAVTFGGFTIVFLDLLTLERAPQRELPSTDPGR